MRKLMTPTLKFKGRSLFFCQNKGGMSMILVRKPINNWGFS